MDWNFQSDLVQDYWNELENQLIGVGDEIVPYRMSEFKTVVEPIPAQVKHKINERRRLMKSNKRLFIFSFQIDLFGPFILTIVKF